MRGTIIMPLKYSDKPLSLADSDGVHSLYGEKLKSTLLEEVTKYDGTLDLSLNGFYMGTGKLASILSSMPWPKLRGLKLSNSMLDDDDMIALQTSLQRDANLLEELYLDYNSGLDKLDSYDLRSFFSSLPKGLKILNLDGTWLKKDKVLQAIDKSYFRPDSLTIYLDSKKLDVSKETEPSQKKLSDFEKPRPKDGLASSTSLDSLSKLSAASGKTKQLHTRSGVKSEAEVVMHGRRAGKVRADAEVQQLSDHSDPKSKEVIAHGRRAGTNRPGRLFSSSDTSSKKSESESESTPIPDGPPS